MTIDPFKPLSGEMLRRTCNPERFSFQTTAEIAPLETLIGQDRALEAIKFGTRIGSPGFHVYVLGPWGSGKHTAVQSFLQEEAARKPKPDDWVYVNNFDEPHKPGAVCLPPGRGIEFRDSMNGLIHDLLTAIPSMFESDEYRSRRRVLDDSVEEAQEKPFETLRKKATEQNIGILRTPMGFSLAPLHEGKPIKPEVFNVLPEEERNRIEEKVALLQKELEEILQQIPLMRKEYMDRVRALNSEFAEIVVNMSIREIFSRFSDQPRVVAYLNAVKKDLVDNVEIFLNSKNLEEGSAFSVSDGIVTLDPFYRRYRVNVILTSHPEQKDAADGAPVVSEDYPTLANLTGRIEHMSQQGALVTDFTLIKAGALHKANGGFLVLDARRVLSEPFAWDALKRCLRSGTITIHSAAEQFGLASTISLEPDPIPLSIKVILVGERILYYLLVNLDPDFQEIFKVNADFEDDIEWSEETAEQYARLIATLVKKEGIPHLSREAVAKVIEESSRLSEDSAKLSLKIGEVSDILHEAAYWCVEDGRDLVHPDDIDRAISKRKYRSDRIRNRTIEQITDNIVLIDTDGERTGQINGLSVISLGNTSFGRPSRITARVRMGAGKVVDIEREVELGGPIHSKGVMILTSFLSSNFSLNQPLSLGASLVFEQSYGGVEGDSASSAELYALLSALADVPIRQSFAVTGSVNQLGQVQAIGGVNEKIEGFFDICATRGLTGHQGVLIPESNIRHLMLRRDIVTASNDGKFRIFGVRTIEQGIEMLTGVPAGVREADGQFTPGSIYSKVEARLVGFAEARKAWGQKGRDKSPDGDEQS